MRMLLIMREYCHRYSQQPDEDQEQPQQARQDCLVPPEDVAGLSAFLRLFSQACSRLKIRKYRKKLTEATDSVYFY